MRGGWHPFRTPRLSGPDIGWFRPAVAVVLAMVLPALLAILAIYLGAPVLSGPPKDGTALTLADHATLVVGSLAVSFLASWMAAPFALLALRGAAMLGWAGWGSAILCAELFGLPIVHFALQGDITTEDSTILPHIACAIALLGLSVWAIFWGLMRFRRPDRGLDMGGHNGGDANRAASRDTC